MSIAANTENMAINKVDHKYSLYRGYFGLHIKEILFLLKFNRKQFNTSLDQIPVCNCSCH